MMGVKMINVWKLFRNLRTNYLFNKIFIFKEVKNIHILEKIYK